MQPARLPVPPQLLGSLWAPNCLSHLHTCDILRLPGELRPPALRSFHCRVSHQQHHDSASSSEKTASAQTTTYGGLQGLKKVKAAVAEDDGVHIPLVGAHDAETSFTVRRTSSKYIRLRTAKLPTKRKQPYQSLQMNSRSRFETIGSDRMLSSSAPAQSTLGTTPAREIQLLPTSRLLQRIQPPQPGTLSIMDIKARLPSYNATQKLSSRSRQSRDNHSRKSAPRFITDAEPSEREVVDELRHHPGPSQAEQSAASHEELRSFQLRILEERSARINELEKRLESQRTSLMDLDNDSSEADKCHSLERGLQNDIKFHTKLSIAMGLFDYHLESTHPASNHADSHASMKNALKVLALYNKQIPHYLAKLEKIRLQRLGLVGTRRPGRSSDLDAKGLARREGALRLNLRRALSEKKWWEEFMDVNRSHPLPKNQRKSWLSIYESKISKLKQHIARLSSGRKDPGQASYDNKKALLGRLKSYLQEFSSEKAALIQVLGKNLKPPVRTHNGSQLSLPTAEDARKWIKSVDVQIEKLDENIVQKKDAIGRLHATAPNISQLEPETANLLGEQAKMHLTQLELLNSEREAAVALQASAKTKLLDFFLDRPEPILAATNVVPAALASKETSVTERAIAAPVLDFDGVSQTAVSTTVPDSTTYRALKTEIAELKTIILNLTKQRATVSREPNLFKKIPSHSTLPVHNQEPKPGCDKSATSPRSNQPTTAHSSPILPLAFINSSGDNVLLEELFPQSPADGLNAHGPNTAQRTGVEATTSDSDLVGTQQPSGILTRPTGTHSKTPTEGPPLQVPVYDLTGLQVTNNGSSSMEPVSDRITPKQEMIESKTARTELALHDVVLSPSDSTEAPIVKVDPHALLGELFPDEAAKGATNEEDIDVQVPRLPLPIEEESQPLIRTEVVESRPKRTEIVQSARRRDVMTVLELQSGNVSLTEEDFRRLTPKGKHMKEWSVGGEFTKVFPRRNPWTLEREQRGNYYIIFPGISAAQAYLEHIHHVHKLAKQYTPSSLASPIAPPPGYLVNGEDVHSLIQNFTLVAPTQPLVVSTYTIGPGFHPYKANLFARGGYPEIVSEGRDKVLQVLLRMLNGPQPTYYEITDAIGKSGTDRNLAWALVERPDRIRKLEMNRYSRDKSQDEADWDAEERAERVAKYQRPGYGQAWILSFEDREHAKSFVRCWHRRPFPWKRMAEHDPVLTKPRYGHQVTMVEAELLW